MYSKKEEKRDIFKRVFTINLVLLPILNVYSISGIMIGVITTIAITIIAIIKSNWKGIIFEKEDFIVYYLIFFVILLSINSVLSILYEPNYLLNKMIGRFFSLVLYIVNLVLSKYYVDFEYAKKCFRVMGMVVTIGALLQLIVYYTSGNVIQLYIPGLSTTIDELGERWVVDTGFFRPKSILNESSHVAYYLGLNLVIELFVYNRISKKWAALFSIGLITSVSGTGISVLIIIWIIYLLNKASIKLLIEVIFGALLVLGVLYLVGFFEHISYSFSRLDTDSNRFNSFVDYYPQLNNIEKIFGVGMGNTTIRFYEYYSDHNSFMSGFGRMAVEGGLCLTILYLLGCIKIIKKVAFPCKAFVLYFIVLNMVENVFFGYYLTLILMWTYYSSEKRDEHILTN